VGYTELFKLEGLKGKLRGVGEVSDLGAKAPPFKVTSRSKRVASVQNLLQLEADCFGSEGELRSGNGI